MSNATARVARVASITLLGCLLGDMVPGLDDDVDHAALAILFLSALPAAFHWLRRRPAREA